MSEPRVYISVVALEKLQNLVKAGKYVQQDLDRMDVLHNLLPIQTASIFQNRYTLITSLDLLVIDRTELQYYEQLRKVVKRFVIACGEDKTVQRCNWTAYRKMGAVGLVTYTNPPPGFVDLKQGLYELMIKQVPCVAPEGAEVEHAQFAG